MEKFRRTYVNIVVQSRGLYDRKQGQEQTKIMEDLTIENALQYAYENFVQHKGSGCCINYTIALISAFEKMQPYKKFYVIFTPDIPSGVKSAVLYTHNNELFVADIAEDIINDFTKDKTIAISRYKIPLKVYLKKEGVNQTKAWVWDLSNDRAQNFKSSYEQAVQLKSWKNKQKETI